MSEAEKTGCDAPLHNGEARGLPSPLRTLLAPDEATAALRRKLAAERRAALENQRKLHVVTEAGIAFSRERDTVKILEIALTTARQLTNADAGTIYMLHERFAEDPVDPGRIEQRELRFVALQNDTMETYLSGSDIDLMPPVPLEVNGQPNLANVSAHCVNQRALLNFDDVYAAQGFAFEGTETYDLANEYRSKSMLVIPLEDHENTIVGVLQLINRRSDGGSIVGFSRDDIELVQSVSFPAAASITTQRLIREQAQLFDAFLEVLAQGLGEKSPHTYNHIHRVTALGEAISDAVNRCAEGPYAGVGFDDEELAEIRLAGLMHDIGKLTTPEHIVSKQVKLQFVMDRFELIVERFNSRLKDLRIAMLEQQMAAMRSGEETHVIQQIAERYQAEAEVLSTQLHALCKANRGGESVDDDIVALIEELSLIEVDRRFAADIVSDHGHPRVRAVSATCAPGRLIDAEEKENLLVDRGTLNPRERDAIKLHANRSWRWLMALPFPRKQKRLPLYAGAHHENLDGSGYPNGIAAAQLPLQSRILAVADIFEALVAPDRPYREPMLLSEALEILGDLVKAGKLDGELVRIFLQTGAVSNYAEKYLEEGQIDSIDLDRWMANYYVAPAAPDTLPAISP